MATTDELYATLVRPVAGDVIVLADGVYKVAADAINGLVIASNVTLRAEHEGGATLDGGGVRTVLVIARGAVVIEGLVITGGGLNDVVYDEDLGVFWPYTGSGGAVLVRKGANLTLNQ